jgi:hypothetical protein
MTKESQKALDALRALALADLDAASDEEIQAELINAGVDPDALAASVAAGLDELVAATLRQQAASAKLAMRTPSPSKVSRPTLAQIKARIARAFAIEPQLATAFRDGTRQSDADLESLYDDLVLMGKISPGNDDGG